VRTNQPAPIRSITESAICPITRIFPSADARAAGQSAARPLSSVRLTLTRGRLPGRRESENQAGEQQTPVVKSRTLRSGPSSQHAEPARSNQRISSFTPAAANAAPSHAARRGEHKAFGEKLPHDARAARAQREAHADLFLPRRGACQQQVGHVGAGDHQHQRHHRHQHVQRVGEIAAQAGDAGRGVVQFQVLLQNMSGWLRLSSRIPRPPPA
jgi:hypothetical protein